MNSTGKLISTAVLTSGASVSNGMVKFVFNAHEFRRSNKLSNDPLDITACDGELRHWLGCNNTSNNNVYQSFTNAFCPTSYIVKLAPIIYLVCARPWQQWPPGAIRVVIRQISRIPSWYGYKTANKYVVMEQIIGFRVGSRLMEWHL